MAEEFGDDSVRRLTILVNEPDPDLPIRIPFSRPASLVSYALAFEDALLDVRGWRGLILLAWALVIGFLILTPARQRVPPLQ